jgi:hypothetical protein
VTGSCGCGAVAWLWLEAMGRARWSSAAVSCQGGHQNTVLNTVCRVSCCCCCCCCTHCHQEERTLIQPAVAGTENVLHSVNATPSVTRVVLTSSTAAVFTDATERGQDHVFTEADWNCSCSTTRFPYFQSKKQAEQVCSVLCGRGPWGVLNGVVPASLHRRHSKPTHQNVLLLFSPHKHTNNKHRVRTRWQRRRAAGGSWSASTPVPSGGRRSPAALMASPSLSACTSSLASCGEHGGVSLGGVGPSKRRSNDGCALQQRRWCCAKGQP